MLRDEIRAEQLAEVFHHYQQTLTDNLGGATAQAESWDALSNPERERLISAARLTLIELDSQTNPRKYFAKPGEAEWGC